MNDIPEFLRGFAKPKPIQIGDKCRNKSTGVYSVCKRVDDGMYFGYVSAFGRWDVGLKENYEKV